MLELFAGLGGTAAALGAAAEVVAALDLDRLGLSVYAANLPHPAAVRNLVGIGAPELARLGADLWTLSPPCQPYTRRGRGRDLDDPRAASLVRLLEALPEVRPPYLFLENVPGFHGSRAHRRLREVLDTAGYAVEEWMLCPTELGWPNRRRRYYLLAARNDAEPLRRPPEPRPPAVPVPPLAELVDRSRDGDPELAVPASLLSAYEGALDLVSPDDPAAVTACFTAAYGRSPVRSGSYLVLDDGQATRGLAPPRVRRFHPREVLAILGFPAGFRLPEELPLENGWRLAGNSVSLPAVRFVLEAVPALTGRLR